MILSIHLISILITSFVFAKDCALQQSSIKQNIALSKQFRQISEIPLECIEQEAIDVFLEPFRKQSLALQLCAKEAECMDFLRKETARFSQLSRDRFSQLDAVALWGEIQKYSGLHRIRGPSIEDLPLNSDPIRLFESLKSQKLAERELNKNEHLKFACSALAAIMGPAKFKALNAGIKLAAASKVVLHHDVEKLISKNRLPQGVKDKFLKWIAQVEEKGLDEVRKIPSFHDEPIRSLPGRQSIRLNDGYRACYEQRLVNGVVQMFVITISNDHKETSYCR